MKRKSQGFARRLEVYFYDWSDEARFRYSDDRFERPLKDIYKFIICHSYRDKGKNKKYQYVILSTGYYWLVDEMFCLWDYFDVRAGSNREKKLQEFSKNVGMSIENLFYYTYDKIEKIRQPLIKEYHKTKEYKTNKKNEEIIRSYQKEKRKFDDKYGPGTYEKCYNVFGKLWNMEKLKEIEEQYKKNQEYQQRSRDSYRNYSGYSSFVESKTTYTEKEQEMIKTIYKRMAITFHPDNKNGDADIMKFINSKLKENWGI
jgi:hypothetical protein